MIHYLKHHEINWQKWDDCIQTSFNHLVYAESWYLNIVAPEWEALVEDNFTSMMPVPAKKKFIPYVIQPKFIQQLGIFSTTRLNNEKVKQFLDAIPKKFIFQDFNLNHLNPVESLPNVTFRNNYELSLKNSYKSLHQHYHENTKRNIKKGQNTGIRIHYSAEIKEFINFYQLYSKINHDWQSVSMLQKIITESVKRNKGKILLASKSGKIVAGAFFLTDTKRITYLASFNTPSGMETSAMFMAMDQIIRDYSEKEIILDFEGSMEPGIARFFAGFNAEIVHYARFRNKPAQWIHKD